MFDMEGIAKVGLLKIDFLGLTNLTVIEEALRMVERSTGQVIDIDDIPLDDPATYALLCKADTHGVFQPRSHLRQADPHRHAAPLARRPWRGRWRSTGPAPSRAAWSTCT